MKVILKKLVKIFDEYNINYVLSHGNLIEVVRGEIIPQDDDIDIRLDNKTFDNWMDYCYSISKNDNGEYIDYENNLIF